MGFALSALEPGWGGRASCGYALQIGTHDIGHAVHRGVVPKCVRRELALRPSIAQAFEGYGYADLIAVLEAVRHRLYRAEHGHMHAIDLHALDAFRQGRP